MSDMLPERAQEFIAERALRREAEAQSQLARAVLVVHPAKRLPFRVAAR
jgi:hypothetical protein